MRTPLANARGLGSAKDGTDHFWRQRVTAVALVPLSIWFISSLVALAGANHATLIGWLKMPVNATAMALFIGTGFVHLRLGLQVVIEDYIHADGTKIVFLILNNFFCVVAGLVSVLAVLKIFLGA